MSRKNKTCPDFFCYFFSDPKIIYGGVFSFAGVQSFPRHLVVIDFQLNFIVVKEHSKKKRCCLTLTEV